MWTIAVGDIHGQSAKLIGLLLLIEEWARDHACGAERQLVFLGDYIDRGPDSRGVLETVRALQGKGALCLKGNHEELMIRATQSELDRQNFLINGGIETLRSFETRAVFETAREWMRSLPTHHQDSVRYFVHAGVRPGVPLSAQAERDQLWIRKPFLKHTKPFEKYIVHGHTPTMRQEVTATWPDVRANRCNVDTGAAWDGPLSAAVFDSTQPQPRYLISTLHGILPFPTT